MCDNPSKKRKYIQITILILLAVILYIGVFVCGKYIFLSPGYYPENKNLTERENYFIRKSVLEEMETRYSILQKRNNSSNEYSDERKHLFVFIDTDFMQTVVKNNDNYIVMVKTYYMEDFSDDCIYEIHFSKDFSITYIGLDS